MSQFFWNETDTPLGDILSLRAYSLALNRVISNTKHEVIRYGPTEIGYKGLRVTQSALQSFLQSYLQHLVQFLSSDLLFHPRNWDEITKNLSLHQIASHEDLGNQSQHWYFLKEPGVNPFDGYLLQKALQDPQRQWFLTPNSQVSPDLSISPHLGCLGNVISLVTFFRLIFAH